LTNLPVPTSTLFPYTTLFRSAIERAKAAGFSALVVTIDTAVAGMRERDLRNGVKELLGGNLGSKLPFVSQLLIKPRWLAGFLARSEEHTSELQSRVDLVCRLL